MARNIGMDRATGKYLAFLDADDEWYSDKLLDSMQAILSNNLSMVAHNYWLERGGKAEWMTARPDLRNTVTLG